MADQHAAYAAHNAQFFDEALAQQEGGVGQGDAGVLGPFGVPPRVAPAYQAEAEGQFILEVVATATPYIIAGLIAYAIGDMADKAQQAGKDKQGEKDQPEAYGPPPDPVNPYTQGPGGPGQEADEGFPSEAGVLYQQLAGLTGQLRGTENHEQLIQTRGSMLTLLGQIRARTLKGGR